MPQPSRRIRKLIPPRRRSAWSQPATWMRWPMCAATSTERMRPPDGAEPENEDECDECAEVMRDTPVGCYRWPAVRMHLGKGALAGQPNRRNVSQASSPGLASPVSSSSSITDLSLNGPHPKLLSYEERSLGCVASWR